MFYTKYAAFCGALCLATPSFSQTVYVDDTGLTGYQQAVACPITLTPAQGGGVVSCVGRPGFVYSTVSSVDDVPAGYQGRIFVLNPYDSGYQEFGE